MWLRPVEQRVRWKLIVPSAFAGFRLCIIVRLGGADFDLGVLVETVGATSDDHVGGDQSSKDLHVIAIRDAEGDGLGVRGSIGANDHDGLAAVLRGENGGSGGLQRLSGGFCR